ncbi:hypothetical protein BH11BAC4_BH11BAC4_20960 [soil metagenome]
MSLTCTAYRSLSFLLISILLSAKNTNAQNLFANSGFESLNFCVELKQFCSPEAWFNIKPVCPPQVTFSPLPFEGAECLILDVENVYRPIKNRSFVYTMFCCPLQKGKNYKLAFYLHTAQKKFYGIDFYFRHEEFTSTNFLVDTIRPSVHISMEDIISEYRGWNYIETIYTAKGDERFCLLGNMSRDTFHFTSSQRMNKMGDVYYYLDNISFTPEIPAIPCSDYEASSKRLYDQDHRHTEQSLVGFELSEPELITDTISVPAVFFETDKSVLKPAFKKLIDSLLLKMADKKTIHISIEGYTDARGTNERNDKLSTDRAQSVRNYFILRSTRLKDNITAAGRGENFPKATNTTQKGRAKNRRVEIILSYTK